MYLQHYYEINIVSPSAHPEFFNRVGKPSSGFSIWDQSFRFGKQGGFNIRDYHKQV
jgi:hypothetical protein